MIASDKCWFGFVTIPNSFTQNNVIATRRRLVKAAAGNEQGGNINKHNRRRKVYDCV